MGVQVDIDDCMPWRCEPEGTAEIIVRSALMDGHPAVDIQTDPEGNIQSTTGGVGISWLTPAEARALAALILRSADAAEGAK
ncbi:hypothetical protein [Cellulosimicrobium cellulans]|uniref:hypothetical protein n=1 Tax=Cellulosimicrobium cellulans TaxID=1710 RepID=UPI00165206ED|nr:hypothetical protein [Cellulosimicrobium cellulans]